MPKTNATTFILGGSKITADGDSSHEIKRRLLLGRKVMTNLESTFKSRDITLPTKVCLVKAMVFPVVIYGCESWTGKKAERRRIDAFEMWCWRRLLRVPWIARRANQSILNEISPEYSLEGLMLKLKLQYCGHLIWRTNSLEKTMMLGKIEGWRRRGQQRMRWTHPREMDYKESWAPKNWWFWTVVLEKTHESPLDCREIQPVHHKRNQSWIFIGRTDAKAETSYFGHLM